jgi:hypothetical protein
LEDTSNAEGPPSWTVEAVGQPFHGVLVSHGVTVTLGGCGRTLRDTYTVDLLRNGCGATVTYVETSCKDPSDAWCWSQYRAAWTNVQGTVNVVYDDDDERCTVDVEAALVATGEPDCESLFDGCDVDFFDSTTDIASGHFRLVGTMTIEDFVDHEP